jgi:hypothetical protein
MEVEVLIFHIREVQLEKNGRMPRPDSQRLAYLSHVALVSLLNGLLVTFLINEVDHRLMAIYHVLRDKMLPHRQFLATRLIPVQVETQRKNTNRVFQFHNQQIRLVSQTVDFRPEKRDASAYLHKTEPTRVSASTPSWFFDEKNLLCLIEVGDIAVMVYTATEETSASSEAATAANES